ncbi:hypothetical protein HYQ45_010757 [Verticillium longisporum]|uniref:Carboxymuconolactone decarboxylase-like domain-containing protein n=1 Tax=Verticillium longisporum TaxID=100787 RepID=A0A8I2ZIR1_VERLO|nr:hypothetical protein HYQ44_011205 [Verticillium longisporum]KAG7130377.1 hypothetical protein HYQ45_010757 [Verticillium longisporum]
MADQFEVPKPLVELFEQIEENIALTQLGSSKWYMITLAALVGSNDPDLCADLYTHLLTKPEFSTPEQRQELVRRLREGLFKTISVVGVCKPMSAILAINAREREEDKDRSITREGWQCDDDSLKRGQEWLAKIYTRDTDSTLDLFKDHRDFAWVSERITYGLYLCDRQVLDDFDTEMVVLCSIMIQNLGRNTHWHLRGTRRLGVSFEDTQKVWDSVQLVAGYLGVKLNRIPTVAAVEKDI